MVSIGTVTSNATLTVDGGIQVGENLSETPLVGTIRYTEDDGLEGYLPSGWISLNEIDTDVVINPSFGIVQNGTQYRLASFSATVDEVMYSNGVEWVSNDSELWETVDDGLLTNGFLSIGDFSSFDFSMMVRSNPDLLDSQTRHALVLGNTDATVIDPDSTSILFNAVYNENDEIISMGQSLSSTDIDGSFSGQIHFSDNVLSFQHSNQRYQEDQVVSFSSLLNVSPTSVYIDDSDATFDMSGSIAFVSTLMDHYQWFPDYFGIGHRNQIKNFTRFYLFQRDDYKTIINGGFDGAPGNIEFYIEDTMHALF